MYDCKKKKKKKQIENCIQSSLKYEENALYNSTPNLSVQQSVF